jgi:hypothetical protein
MPLYHQYYVIKIGIHVFNPLWKLRCKSGLVVLLSFCSSNNIMASTATKHRRMFRFPREEELYNMVSHACLRGGVGSELVGHFFYNIRSSDMDSGGIAKT